jgi:hypothetical protein
MNVMYIVSAILLFPACVLLWIAWRRKIETRNQPIQPRWRRYCLADSLVAASCATLACIGRFASWFHNGGSPHGLLPSPGLWKPLGPVFMWTLCASIVLALLGKGKPRLMILGWASAITTAFVLIHILEMD